MLYSICISYETFRILQKPKAEEALEKLLKRVPKVKGESRISQAKGQSRKIFYPPGFFFLLTGSCCKAASFSFPSEIHSSKIHSSKIHSSKIHSKERKHRRVLKTWTFFLKSYKTSISIYPITFCSFCCSVWDSFYHPHPICADPLFR